jgi:serine/threonine protein phosphatase PrpC
MMLLTQRVSQERARRAGAHSHVTAFKYLSIGATNVGCVRTLNEDAFLDRPDIGLWAVADGMGGHEGGEVASQAVVDALHSVDSFGSAYTYRHGVSEALQGVNNALIAYAEERMSGPVGATVVSLLVHEGHYACVWAGDSRAYLYRDNQLRRLTRDHSLVQELVDKGQVRPDQARSHANANVITRAIGARAELELDAVHGAIRPGDRFLLCSDGLTSVVDDREIADILLRPPLQGAVDRLIQRALSRGAPDNVTAVLVGAEPRMGASDALG